MKNYCGVHLQLVKKLDGGRLHGVITLNPESQIKILENSLNSLSGKNSSLKTHEQKNSSSFSSQCPTGTSLSPNAVPHDDPESVKITENVVSKKASDGGNSNQQSRNTNFDNTSGIKNERIGLASPCIKIDDKKISSKCKNNTTICSRAHNKVDSTKSEISQTSECDSKPKEGDSQYEFTLEHEKIVSFVCSPTPTRKQISSCHLDDRFNSDVEFGVNSVNSLSVEDKLIISKACKNMAPKPTFRENNMWEKSAKGSRLLWHPPPIGKYAPIHQETNSFFNCCSLSNRCFEASPAETVLSFRNPASANGAINKNKVLKSSFNQESVLFREASLRGCYNIESIIRDMKPPQKDLEQNITKVRESIYSAIRVQKHNDDIIPDGVVAILDICKSWINLNSHFEREEFKEVIESYGIDPSVVSDFLHWQCISRSFIDKMVEALKKITFNRKHRNNNLTSWNFNGSFNVTFQGSNNVNKRYMNVPIVDGDTSHFIKKPGGYSNTSKTEISNTKHWKQRRFLLDQQKAEKSKRFVKPNLTTSNCTNNIPKYSTNGDLAFSFGQGQNIPLYYSRDYCFGKNNGFSSTNNMFSPFSSIGLNAIPQSVFSTDCLKNDNFYKLETQGINEFCILQRDQNIDNLRSMNELTCCSTPSVMGIASNHNSLSVQTMPTGPQYFNNQACYVNTGQSQENVSQALISQNPILCIDTDITDNCMKNSYMKPGNYNPPQKPTNCLSFSNNSIPIKEEEVTGFSFLYSSGSQSILHEINGVNIGTNLPKHVLSDDHFVDKTEDSWKDALSSANTIRESLIASKMESPNLKLSETVSFKSHFLLSDDISQHSSSNGFKIESECEEFNVTDVLTPSKEMSIIESRLKTTDWLIKSFKESVSENSEEYCKDLKPLDDIIISIDDEANKDIKKERSCDQDLNYEILTRNIALTNNKGNNYDCDRNADSNLLYQNGVDYPQKKPKKGKKIRNDCWSYFEHPVTLLHRKPKSIFKRTVTKHISSKLEDILNCIWKVEVSNLITDNVISEQDKTRLELNVRSPLYLQAMKCKLSNHSYDTLEQALADFQQYFVDTKSRNKGEKQSIEAITALEQLFFDLVEKNFGLTKQHYSQIMGPVGVKPHRQKKPIRRC